MFNFKKKKEWVCRISYYKFDSNLYKVRYVDYIDKKDVDLSNKDIFNKYGCRVSQFSPVVDGFIEWTANFYETYDHFINTIVETEDKKIIEINEEDLENAIEMVKTDLQKKFDDFKLDDTLYTRREIYSNQYFRTIAKVKRKLIDLSIPENHQSLLLEIETLNGFLAESKREFIPFYDFLLKYKEGCDIKVVESGDKWIKKTEEYFD